MPWAGGQFSRFRFYQPQLGVRTWNKKVYFQTLLIPKIVEFLAHPTIGLAFIFLLRRSLQTRGLGMATAQAQPMMSGPVGNRRARNHPGTPSAT